MTLRSPATTLRPLENVAPALLREYKIYNVSRGRAKGRVAFRDAEKPRPGERRVTRQPWRRSDSTLLHNMPGYLCGSRFARYVNRPALCAFFFPRARYMRLSVVPR